MHRIVLEKDNTQINRKTFAEKSLNSKHMNNTQELRLLFSTPD